MILRGLFASLLCLALCGQERPLLLKAARLLDVRTGKVETPGRLWVKDGRIQPGPPPANAETLDLGDRTLLPGLIDCHTHLLFPAGLGELGYLKRSQGALLLDGVVNARKVLEAGFTTVRDVGASAGFGDVALRDAIARGDIPGPRMLVAGPSLSITGGHGDLNGFPPHLHTGDEHIVDSPDQGRHVVREWRKRGVDLIKIHATGGVLSNHDDPGAPSFSPVEFKAIVEEANRRGMDVCAHAHGDAGILEATLAGVRSIEHGSLLSPATAREMKVRGTFLVPTLYALESILLPGNPYHFPEGSIAKARTILPLRRAGFKAALDAGLPIAYGTDIGVFEHRLVAMDFRYLVDYGMTPLQAIQSATVVAARLLRLDSEVGTLEAGRAADIIAVDGDPLKDITTLERVPFVLQGGKVVRRVP
ncbi:metal-dependent hydrolase family protein [Geothrix edaphica]|uniref:Xaa-Pro dipeptidase n=1 Tax=Geothrix edaphica TaxID=2927976 RepID=A0ABQ5PTG2_9BACT|nr:amidohydrolase family protein [Geothrix edaphica]GLH65797.1 Xaa-Pro dipeptidase [Geothrix edaphica]